MIGTQTVENQAKNPNMALWPLRAYVNSPSSLRLRNVPKRIGDWHITKVYIEAIYPDGETASVDCVLVGGLWVGTLEGSATAGTCTNGYTIYADGVDEHGNNVTGYVLGKGDVVILQSTDTPEPEQATVFVKLRDDGTDAKEGDIYPTEDGYVIQQDGEAHQLGTPFDQISTYVETQVSSKADVSALNKVSQDVTDLESSLSDYYTKNETSSNAELSTIFETKADISAVPTKVSQLSNDSSYITSAQVQPATNRVAYPAFAQNAVAATQLNAYDTQALAVTDKASFNAYVTYNQNANTYDLVLKGQVVVPNNWYISKLFSETFSPELTLSWRRGTIYRKRVIGGTTRWTITYNNGWMWLLNGRYAITASAEGEEDGNLYVLFYEDETHQNCINDSATDVHTLTFSFDNYTKLIATIDGQTGQATGSRNTLNNILAFSDDLAYRDELSSYLPLSGGAMSGDITIGKDNKIIFGNHDGRNVIMTDPTASDFGIHLSSSVDGAPMISLKYIFNDIYSLGFVVEEPYENNPAIIRGGDLYVALSAVEARISALEARVSTLENN